MAFISRSLSLRSSVLAFAAILVVLSSLFGSADALKFEMEAFKGSKAKVMERCIRHYAHSGQLVVVTAIVGGTRGDGQVLNMSIKDVYNNEYARPRDVVGENRYAFTAHQNAHFDVCLENIQTGSQAGVTRHVELGVDIGADAKDWAAIQADEKLRPNEADEKLKPIEADLRRAEEVMNEVIAEMDYLRTREAKLRDTNESTNERVKWFSIGSITLMLVLGVWQAFYLRAYFKSKHMI